MCITLIDQLRVSPTAPMPLFYFSRMECQTHTARAKVRATCQLL